MPKVNPYHLTEKDRRELLIELDAIFTSCRSSRELSCLLRGLLSQDERVMLARRIRIAKMLLEGKRHVEIAGELGVGFDTILRVRRWLEREKTTYHILVERTRRQAVRSQRQTALREAPPFSWADFRRRYRMHFWPVELVEEVGQLVESYQRRHRPPAR